MNIFDLFLSPWIRIEKTPESGSGSGSETLVTVFDSLPGFVVFVPPVMLRSQLGVFIVFRPPFMLCGCVTCVYRMDAMSSLKAGDLLEPLTLKNADELFDMEKLEIIGDVFLKYR